jgi:hypothetical protein
LTFPSHSRKDKRVKQDNSSSDSSDCKPDEKVKKSKQNRRVVHIKDSTPTFNNNNNNTPVATPVVEVSVLWSI